MRNIVINADDYGLSQCVNRAVYQAHQNGILTSASVMPNAKYFDEAVEIAKECPQLGIGVHLNIFEGKSLNSTCVPLLTNENSMFDKGFIRLKKEIIIRPEVLKEIKLEFLSQTELAFDVGLSVDHINSDMHFHMVPQVYQIVTEIAKKFKIPYVRFSREKFSKHFSLFSAIRNGGIIKNIFLWSQALSCERYSRINADVFGIINTDKMNKINLLRSISSVKQKEIIIEIITHPALVNKSDQLDYLSSEYRDFTIKKEREIEFNALIDNQVKECIINHQFELCRFQDIAP